MSNRSKSHKKATLTSAAAALSLVLAAVATMPAVADTEADKAGMNQTQSGSPTQGEDAGKASDEGKASNPCAVKKKKKKKGPCAVGG